MTDRIAGDRGRRPRRFLLGALIAAALAVAMSGCIIIKSNNSVQLNTIGGVQVTTTLCASDTSNPPNNTGYSPADPTCQKFATGGNANAGGNSGSDAINNTNTQVTVAYRIPTTATAPSTTTSTNATCNNNITFNQSASLASAIETLSPAGSGKQWVGYISAGQNYTTAGCQYITVAPTFTLQQGSDGSPFQGPFNYRVVAGYRDYNDSVSGNGQARTVTCGNNLYALYNDGTDQNSDGKGDQTGICIDDPNSSTVATDLSQTTRDLGVIPTNTSVHAGATATVPFNLKYAGATGSGAFTVAASTSVPSTTATPSITTLTPAADSNNNMTVSVPVPAGTTPNTYTVTVTATCSGCAVRTGVATLTVGQNFTFDTAPALPTLGTIILNGQAQTKTAQMNNFSVNDTTASPSGWNVTVTGDSSAGKSPVFKQYCNNGGSACGSDPANSYVSGGRTLAASSLTLNSTGASWTGGTGSAPAFQCAGGSCAIDSASATKIGSAANGSAGTGLWTTNGFSASSVKLSTPSTLRVLPANEIYRLDIVWSLNSGP